MSGNVFEVGKKYKNGFSVSEYGMDWGYSFNYVVLSRSAKFVVLYDELKNKSVKCKVNKSEKDGHEWVYSKQIYPYRLSADSVVA